MTRSDFILGILCSLIATILFELTRKVSPQFCIKSVKRFGALLLRITIPIVVAFLSAVKNGTTYALSTKASMALITSVIVFFTIAELPLYSVFAPSPDSKIQPIEMRKSVDRPQVIVSKPSIIMPSSKQSSAPRPKRNKPPTVATLDDHPTIEGNQVGCAVCHASPPANLKNALPPTESIRLIVIHAPGHW